MDSKILEILVKHQLTATPQLLAAMREVYTAGTMSLLDSVSPSSSADDAEDDNSPILQLSERDKQAMRALGIDPSKSFQLRNSRFTIVGYKPSRWKFPIVAQTQNGTRYKFTVAQIKGYQK